jgi:hypothetical protein
MKWIKDHVLTRGYTSDFMFTVHVYKKTVTTDANLAIEANSEKS